MIKLSCKSCGAKLELTDDIDRFNCGSCGNEWIVNRSGGIVSLKGIEEEIKKVGENTEKTAENTEVLAGEVKIKRIRERIESLIKEEIFIDLEPRKRNPEYNKAVKDMEKDNQDAKRKDIRKSFVMVCSTIITMIIIGILFVKFEKIVLKLGFFEKVIYGCIIVFVILIININLFSKIFKVSLSFNNKGLKKAFNLPPMHITDEEQKKTNLSKIREIQLKIKDLNNNIKEIESKI